MAEIPFHRCLNCYADEAVWVSVIPPAKFLGDTDYDYNGLLPKDKCGTLPHRLLWRPLKSMYKAFESTPLLGGQPIWVQYEETPACPSCKERMDFVVQIPGGEGFPFVVEGGTLYAFWCKHCYVTASLHQQS